MRSVFASSARVMWIIMDFLYKLIFIGKLLRVKIGVKRSYVDVY